MSSTIEYPSEQMAQERNDMSVVENIESFGAVRGFLNGACPNYHYTPISHSNKSTKDQPTSIKICSQIFVFNFWCFSVANSYLLIVHQPVKGCYQPGGVREGGVGGQSLLVKQVENAGKCSLPDVKFTGEREWEKKNIPFNPFVKEPLPQIGTHEQENTLRSNLNKNQLNALNFPSEILLTREQENRKAPITNVMH
jgi:hypothetical protein